MNKGDLTKCRCVWLSVGLTLFLQFTCFTKPVCTESFNSKWRSDKLLRDKGKPGHPAILVPGDGGSQFQAKLDKPSVVHFYCEKITQDWFDLWLNLEQMVPYVIDCWVDNMRLVYDPKTRTTKNAPGVQIRIPGWGNTSTVEYLDPSQISASKYFSSIVESMVLWGYERGVTVAAAPYDFRKAPNEQAEFFIKFKKLVEEMYGRTKKSVILIAHSMGNPYMLHFLNEQKQTWKDTYLHSLVGLAGVWGGSVKPYKVFASGDNLDIWVLPSHKMRAGQRTYPSIAYLMPQPNFWNSSTVFVRTVHKNYTLNDMETFFKDINWTVGYSMWKDAGTLVSKLAPPNIEVHCLHGSNVKTSDTFFYGEGDFPDKQPDSVYGDGDGTVNMRSLRGCLRWQSQQNAKVFEKSFPGVDHMGILHDKNAIRYIKTVLYS